MTGGFFNELRQEDAETGEKALDAYKDSYTFFQLHKEMKDVFVTGNQTWDDVTEKFRKAYIDAMVRGTNLVIDLDTIPGDWAKINLPLQEILFDSTRMYDEWERRYVCIIKPEETEDGNRENVFRHPDFGITILVNMSDKDYDDQMVQNVIDQIPHCEEKFKKVYTHA